MMYLICVMSALFAAWIILLPWTAQTAEAPQGLHDSEDALESRRRICLQELRDLELDVTTQKISQEDYVSSRQALTDELGLVYQKLDALRGVENQG